MYAAKRNTILCACVCARACACVRAHICAHSLKLYVYHVSARVTLQVVFNVAKHIHGGLGWGTAVVAPVPDEEAYLKHAVLHGKAEQLLADEGEASAALAKQMLTRCLAYYESVTPHWICSQRKSRCLQQLGQAECRLPKGLAAAEARFHAGMRAAQKELGANHEITRRSTWQVCEHTHIHPTQPCMHAVFATGLMHVHPLPLAANL